MLSFRRRMVGTTILAVVLGLVFALSGWMIQSVENEQTSQNQAHLDFTETNTANVTVIKRAKPVMSTTNAVPVVVYHEMDNGCNATALTCKSAIDPQSVSQRQFRDEMTWLVQHGYYTITMSQYVAWLTNKETRLPAEPILLIADNGIGNFDEGAQRILAHDGFVMTVAVITGFADGANLGCVPLISVAGKKYDVQPGCGRDNVGWDLTWGQLSALAPSVYNFVLEAGASGHFPQTYDKNCAMFNTCKLPGETNAQYETRITAELSGGVTELSRQLTGRVTTAGWVVPYSDLGYPQGTTNGSTPQTSTSPKGWLANFSAQHFTAVFVEDAIRNGIQHERYRFDIANNYPLSYFASTLQSQTAAGDFNWSHK